MSALTVPQRALLGRLRNPYDALPLDALPGNTVRALVKRGYLIYRYPHHDALLRQTLIVRTRKEIPTP